MTPPLDNTTSPQLRRCSIFSKDAASTYFLFREGFRPWVDRGGGDYQLEDEEAGTVA